MTYLGRLHRIGEIFPDPWSTKDCEILLCASINTLMNKPNKNKQHLLVAMLCFTCVLSYNNYRKYTVFKSHFFVNEQTEVFK